MTKKTEYSPDSDPSKQLAREAVRRFIGNRLSKDERRHANMVCLPSVGFHDVYEVSDPLGIPRCNVTGVECDPKIYRLMEKKNPGIKLFYGTDREFFESSKGPYKVISLDYTGMFDKGSSDTLDIMFGRHLLGEHGILHTNFFGSRENKSSKEAYVLPVKEIVETMNAGAIAEAVNGQIDISNILASVDKRNSETRRVIENSDLKSMRNMIATDIMHCAFNGPHKIFKDDFQPLTDSEYFQKIPEKCVPAVVNSYICQIECRPYICDALDSYRYISSSGSPMLTDIFDFNTHPEMYRFYGKLDIRPDGIFLSGKRVDEFSVHPMVKSFISKAQRAMEKYALSADVIKERKFLGSSAKPVLSPERARELIMQGVPIEEIVKNYRGVTKQRLAAYKAWKTMRKN